MGKGSPLLEKHEDSQAYTNNGCSIRKDEVKGHKSVECRRHKCYGLRGSGYLVTSFGFRVTVKKVSRLYSLQDLKIQYTALDDNDVSVY